MVIPKNKKRLKKKKVFRLTIDASEKPDNLRQQLAIINNLSDSQIASGAFEQNRHFAFAVAVYKDVIRYVFDNIDMESHDLHYLERDFSDSMGLLFESTNFKALDSVAINLTDGVFRFLNYNDNTPLGFVKDIITKSVNKSLNKYKFRFNFRGNSRPRGRGGFRGNYRGNFRGNNRGRGRNNQPRYRDNFRDRNFNYQNRNRFN